MINHINAARRCHIITLEDPIEFIHKHNHSIVNQREIGRDTKTYASGLRAALREDPDVILIGEMRDLETISIAITAAETGHLVLSTLHTTGAAQTIDRIVDVFPPYQQNQIKLQLSMYCWHYFAKAAPRHAEGTRGCPGNTGGYPSHSQLDPRRKTHQIDSMIRSAAGTV